MLSSKVSFPETSHPHMKRVKAKNTSLELKLRRLLLSMGYRGYRIHYGALPGKPDVVFTRYKKVIFAHGCFWHGHDCKAGKNTPRTNKNYWEPKLKRNAERDRKNQIEIRKQGWDVITIWECELKKPELVKERLRKLLEFSPKN